jgi:hypothetical protein
MSSAAPPFRARLARLLADPAVVETFAEVLSQGPNGPVRAWLERCAAYRIRSCGCGPVRSADVSTQQRPRWSGRAAFRGRRPEPAGTRR